MKQTEVSREEIMAVFPKVAETMADALGCDVEDVKLDVPLIEGLDAESIDFLDMVFRLERAFKVKIPRGKIMDNARGDLPVERIAPDALDGGRALLGLSVHGSPRARRRDR